MKAFVVFPTICVFLLTLTMMTMGEQARHRKTLFLSVMLTVLFSVLMTWFSTDAFSFLYYSNFIGLLVCIPCLTYLANRSFSKAKDEKISWIRVLGLGILSTVITVAIAGFLIFMSFMHNPMDPPSKKQPTEDTSD